MATLTYVYADSVAVLGPLATYAEPHAYDLCLSHAERLSAPQGWSVVRLAPEFVEPEPTHDDLVALAEAVLRGDRLADKPHWLAEAHRNYAELLRDGEKQSEALDHYRAFLQLAPAAHPARAEVERLLRASRR